MSIATVNYLRSASLLQRYTLELDNAQKDARLTADERAWLLGLTRPADADDPDPVRADRLMLNDGLANPFELSTALLLSHAQTDVAQVYLYTLTDGIEPFQNRHALNVSLHARFAEGDAAAVFEFEKIETGPFQAQLRSIVDHQVEHVRQVSAQLKLTPTLFDACAASLTHALRSTVAHLPLDPKTHVLQLVREASEDAESLLNTQTLAQSIFDDCRKAELAEGVERRFLDAQGAIADAADAEAFSQAFVDAAATVAEQYRRLLDSFWSGTWRGRHTRRDLAIECVRDAVRRAFYRHRQDGSLSSEMLDAVRSLLGTVTGALPTAAAVRCSRMTLKVGNSAARDLAGTFVIQPVAGEAQWLLWFTPDHRLVAFADLAALTDSFATAQGRQTLRAALTLVDQPGLLSEGRVQLGLEEIKTAPFSDRADSIQALQARNLKHALGLSASPDRFMAMIDDALDIRQLLDPRQLQLSAGRWRDAAPFDFERIWNAPAPIISTPAPSPAPAVAVPVTLPNPPSETRTTNASWLERTHAFESRVKRLRQLDTQLQRQAEQALQPYLSVLIEDALRVGTVRVRWLESGLVDATGAETRVLPVSASGQMISLALPAYLLECVSGRRPRVLPDSARVLFDASTAADADTIELINHALGTLAEDFTEQYVKGFYPSRSGFVRQGDHCVQPTHEAVGLREDALRLDLALRKRQVMIDDTAVELVRQALDRPVRSLRAALGVAVTEAFSVALSYDDNPGRVLCDALVLRQPLNPSGSVMLWSGGLGWRQFTSVAALEAMLRRELYQSAPERWLDRLAERDATLLRNHLRNGADNAVQIHLESIDGHVIEVLQQHVMARQQEDLRQLCVRAARCRFDATLFAEMASAIEHDGRLEEMLDGLSVRISNSLFEALLPPWTRAASLADLKLYLHIWTRYFLSTVAEKDILFDIPLLTDFAAAQLISQLEKDFPGQSWSPDKITLTSRHYVSATPATGEIPSAVAAATVVHRESLTEFSINRFVNDPVTVLTIESTDSSPAVHLLTPAYVQRLVRTVDVGRRFMALLSSKLTPEDPDFAVRQRLFYEQLPAMLLALALPLKLKGQLSQSAFDFISSVLEMPDGLAREPVAGTRVIISAMQLVPMAGMAPDTVSGVYLICPADPGKGPVVVYAAQHPDWTLREYASQSALLDAVRSDEALQQLLLARLDSEVTSRYDHGGFVEPHVPFSVESFNDFPLSTPGPITLQLDEVKGNALQFLFSGMVKLFLDVGVSNVVTNAQADHADRIFLATLGVEQAMTLLPGKLAALVGLWQSHTLFRASAASASGRRWGQALSEFSAALGVMITVREQAIEDLSPDERNPSEALPVAGEERGTPAAFSWGDNALNAEQRMRLQGLEAKSVSLNDMRHDPLLNLFRDKSSGTPYVVVAGKVYQVSPLPQGVWIIVGADGTQGPLVVLDSNSRWQLNLDLRLRGGGGHASKHSAASADTLADEVLVIEATGMAEIRLHYRERALCIGQAHLQTKRYLENCLDNLNVHQRGAALDPQVERIISDFFGVKRPDPELLRGVERAVKTLFDEIMDASLSPYSSPRYTIGMNRPGREAVNAFVIKGDPKRRVFLTDQFFTVPPYPLKPRAAAEGFDFPNHYRAATLLHELSHHSLATLDIAYLEAMAPFPDLMLENNAANVALRADVERLQASRLSHLSSKSTLFTHYENGQWRDLTESDHRGVETILRITQRWDLDEARDVFLMDAKKRSEILFRNADSVTLLILRLGRRNYVAPGP